MSPPAHHHSGATQPSAPADARGWVDVHNHLLPAVDDGPRDWHEAIALCRALVAQGVTHAAATPHLFGPYSETDRVQAMVKLTGELAQRLAQAELNLTIYQGADVRIDVQWEQALHSGGVLTLGRGGNHILVEPPHDVWIEAPLVCRTLDSAGCVGVLTHPERHPHVKQQGTAVLQEWVDRGVILQVTAGSLLGDFGNVAQRIAWEVLESPVPAIVASDAHDTHKRPPRIDAAAKLITQRLGQAKAFELCRDRPWSLIADSLATPPLPRSHKAAAKPSDKAVEA